MTLQEYQELAARTINLELNTTEQARHALFGLASETGEITGIFQKQLQGHTVDDEALKEEIGDALWMLAELCTARGFSLENIGKDNIDKLRKRYPDGFDARLSIARYREG